MEIEHTKILDTITSVITPLEELANLHPEQELERERFLHLTYQKGDTVFDIKTGKEGKIIAGTVVSYSVYPKK